jgi:hexosaminidase
VRIWVRHFVIGLVMGCGTIAGVIAQASQDSDLSLMPLPARLTRGNGQFVVDGNFDVKLEGYTEPRLMLARKRMLNTLHRETGIPFLENRAPHPEAFVITTREPSAPILHLGEDESYHLEISQAGVKLIAQNPLGVLHGIQTFLQLVHITPEGFAAPSVTIDDAPRFPWRGLMIDTSRHFMPIAVIERNLDGMEAVKLNVFHWHLSDDQGFRVESRDFPLLQEKGSAGLYYTRKQIQEVIEYAAERGIRVVPEFDMPCHTSSWFVGYPDLASAPGPFHIETNWGVFDPAMDPSRESTFHFLDRFIGEMTDLFPDEYFHIGGDECDGKEWNANPHIQAFMTEHGFKNNAELQAYFTARVEKIVTAHHKIAEGWDEVLQPDTPKDVVIQSWRGPSGLAAAARHGNPVVLSNGYYIDLNQPAEQHYVVDPLGGDAASLTQDQKDRILGGEAAMWSEFVTPEIIDSRIWPRTAAIAERLWSPESVRDVNSMYRRLAVVSDHLDYYGLKHQSFTWPMLQRMSGESDPRALAVLASAVQPPMGYQRESLGHFDVFSPLNHLVDAVPPESETARQFKLLGQRIAAGQASPADWQQARKRLKQWRDNDAVLQPQLGKSAITAELEPVSREVSSVAAIGLEALDDLQAHRVMPSQIMQQRLQELKAAKKPKAVLRDMIAGPVELLVNAAGGVNAAGH